MGLDVLPFKEVWIEPQQMAQSTPSENNGVNIQYPDRTDYCPDCCTTNDVESMLSRNRLQGDLDNPKHLIQSCGRTVRPSWESFLDKSFLIAMFPREDPGQEASLRDSSQPSHLRHPQMVAGQNSVTRCTKASKTSSA